MPVVLTASLAAEARISARTTAVVESCQFLTRGRTGRRNPAHGKRSRALVGNNATAASERALVPGQTIFASRICASRL
jgi:hypothetical protein